MAYGNLALWAEPPLWTLRAMEELESSSVTMTFQKGETILCPSNCSRELYLVEHGVVNYRYYSDSGAAATILQKRPGDVFGLKAIFGRGEEYKDYYIVAGTDVRLRRISGERFLTLMRSDSDFSGEVIRYFARYIDAMERKIAHTAVMNSYQRLIWTLVEHAEAQKDGKAVVLLTQQDLAELLFISRQRVSAHLSRLVGRGLIAVRRGRIEILDQDGMDRELESEFEHETKKEREA